MHASNGIQRIIINSFNSKNDNRKRERLKNLKMWEGEEREGGGREGKRETDSSTS